MRDSPWEEPPPDGGSEHVLAAGWCPSEYFNQGLISPIFWVLMSRLLVDRYRKKVLPEYGGSMFLRNVGRMPALLSQSDPVNVLPEDGSCTVCRNVG
jgi:hypothetical protein